MVKWDSHMHPNLLNQPEKAESFIQRAIELHFDVIYFTDHMPLESSQAPDRIPKGAIQNYCARVRELADQYKDQIEIRTGIEMDYEPTATCLRQIEAHLAQGSFDLVLGSTHLGGDEFSVDTSRYDRDTFAEICLRNNEQAIRSGYFDVLTHPDAYRWKIEWPNTNQNQPWKVEFPFAAGMDYRPEHHEEAIRAMFEAARACNVRVEINSSMIYKAARNPAFDREGPHPAPFFMEIARDYPELQYTFASDAHDAKYVGAYYDQLREDPFYHAAICSAEENLPAKRCH